MNRAKWIMGISFLMIAVALPVHALDPSTQTTLFVDLLLNGNHENAGDTFTATAVVTNVGAFDAKHVQAHLIGNFPPTWIITPDQIDLGTIPVGTSKRATFTITRDEHNAVIEALSQGANTLEANSDRVRVPVHPLVALAVVGSMGGLFVLQRKPKASPSSKK